MAPCIVCGGIIDGSEPFWVVGPSRAEHDRCRDWSRHRFPFAAELRRLRARTRAVGRLWLHLVRVGSFLARIEESWPADAHAAVRRARRELELLRQQDDPALGRSPRPRRRGGRGAGRG